MVAANNELEMETLYEGLEIPDEAQYPLESILAAMSVIAEVTKEETIGDFARSIYAAMQPMLTEIVRLRHKAGETTQYSAALVRDILKTAAAPLPAVEAFRVLKAALTTPEGTGN